MKAEFGRGFYATDFSSDKSFYVNNCGYYHDITYSLQVSRPNGRPDYQIIHISKGSIYININGIDEKIIAGNTILFRPDEPQIYYTGKNEAVSYEWLHFSGTEVNNMLDTLKLNKQVYKTDNFYEFSGICKNIVSECRLSCPDEILISSLAATALSLLSKKQRSHLPRFNKALEAIRSEKPYTTDELAQICGLSTYHFIREFKKEYGITPHSFAVNEKAEKAKHLLAQTGLSIKEIAALTGFEDALYFSRVFKKTVGTSPTVYRKQQLNT